MPVKLPLRTPVPKVTVTNGDEALDFGGARYIGNFHKTLPRRTKGTGVGTGEVDPDAYEIFAEICDGGGEFEAVPQAPEAAALVNPQAGRAGEHLGPDPLRIHMPPAPGALSLSTAAEMVELFWMARLRDCPFDRFDAKTLADAVADVGAAYQQAIDADGSAGAVRLGLDLPYRQGATDLQLDISPQTLFRAGLPGERYGPLVSQFLLHDINYGAQRIQQTIVPYKAESDFLETFDDWLRAQAIGRDEHHNSYGTCNNAGNDIAYYELKRRRFSTMRDLARFVNRDALHQAYFNAALLLDGWGAPADLGNPYHGYTHQVGFGTLGTPNLLALVSEVATRALKVVWRQKWAHRRLRPEAYGGAMYVQRHGAPDGSKRGYGLPALAFGDGLNIEATITERQGLLPMAFTAGSPAHPAYGAGHATVAGACVTILKAWFDESQRMDELLRKAMDPPAGMPRPKDPSPYFPGDGGPLRLWQPGLDTDGPLPAYTGADAGDMTIGSELNKLAANVAMGRSMGGVHWRSDNTRSLRLGEQVATIMLSRLLPTYAEKPTLSYTNFDGNEVTVRHHGHVEVPADPDLQAFYERSF